MRLLVDDAGRRFLVPSDTVLNPGPLEVDCFSGERLSVREEEVLAFACTEDEAARWMADQTSREVQDAVIPALEALASVFSGRPTRFNDLLKDRRMSRERLLAGLARAQADPSSFDEDLAEALESTTDPLVREVLKATGPGLKKALRKGRPDED